MILDKKVNFHESTQVPAKAIRMSSFLLVSVSLAPPMSLFKILIYPVLLICSQKKKVLAVF